MFNPQYKYKVAVIGSGISGISSAWFLSQQHEVTLFEKNDYIGGHTHTVDVNLNGQTAAVDTGFIVYNEPNYPLLKALFKHLNIATDPTDMSFAVTVDNGRLEYAGNNLNTLFVQRKNLFSLRHWRMILDILRFNKQAKSDLKQGLSPDLSLQTYLEQHGFSQTMQQDYLLPMAAAIWSCPTETMLQFPASSFLQFFANHGLLNVNDRPQWRTVHNGSRQYLEAIIKLATFDIIQHAVTDVMPPPSGEGKVRLISADGVVHEFDQVVFACHADEVATLLKDKGFELLNAFKYQANQAWLHTDIKQMPQRRSAWASWNYLSGKQREGQRAVAVSYWMNKLQTLPIKQDVFVTLNPITPPDADKVVACFDYHHPVFDRDAIAAQAKLPGLQGHKNCWFAGSYFGYGFHEDGLASGANIARLWHITLPWEH